LWGVAHPARREAVHAVEVIGERKTEPHPRREVSDAVSHDVNRDESISPRSEVDVSDCVA